MLHDPAMPQLILVGASTLLALVGSGGVVADQMPFDSTSGTEPKSAPIPIAAQKLTDSYSLSLRYPRLGESHFSASVIVQPLRFA